MTPCRIRIRTVMVLVAVVAVTVTVGRFAFVRASEAAARSACINNLKQIGLALHNYHSAYEGFPAGTVGPIELPPSRRLSWMVLMYSFLTQGLAVEVETLSAWDSPANRRPRFRHWSTDGIPPPSTTPADDPIFFRCPGHAAPRATPGPLPAEYVGITGVGADAAELPLGHPRAGVFGYDRRTRASEIKDGASVTMMLVETTEALGPWIAGGPPTVRGVDPTRRPYIGPGRPFGGIHRDGAMVLFADGSVRFVTDAIDPKVFEALATIAGGEALPPDWESPRAR